MKKLLTIAVLTGVLVAALGLPAQAGSKTRTFYLHWDDPASDCAGPTFMDVTDVPDSGNGCGYAVQMTGINEVLGASGQGYLSRDWSATKGVPFVLDTSRPITGLFAINGFFHPVQVGNAVLDIKVTASIGGRGETLVEVSQPYTVTPAGGNVVEISVDLPKKLNKKKATSLTLSATIRGHAVGQHYIDLDTNPAHLVIPTF